MVPVHLTTYGSAACAYLVLIGPPRGTGEGVDGVSVGPGSRGSVIGRNGHGGIYRDRWDVAHSDDWQLEPLRDECAASWRSLT